MTTHSNTLVRTHHFFLCKNSFWIFIKLIFNLPLFKLLFYTFFIRRNAQPCRILPYQLFSVLRDAVQTKSLNLLVSTYIGERCVGEEGEAFKQILVVIVLNYRRPVRLNRQKHRQKKMRIPLQ